MKKILLLMVAMVAGYAASSQDTTVYLPAFEPGQIWHEARIYFPTSSTARCRMDSAAVMIDSTEYYGFNVSEVEMILSFFHSTKNYMRQTEDHSRVYVKYYKGELLSYDMNLQVGDTCGTVYTNRIGRVYMVVDSVYHKDGRKHIRFSSDSLGVSTDEDTIFHELYQPLEFVEGIGPTWGWLWREGRWSYIMDRMWGGVMMCVWRDGEQVNEDFETYLADYTYDDGNFDCVLNPGYYVTIHQPAQASYTLSPNPVAETLTITGLPDSRVRVEVYDLAGRLLLRKEASASDPAMDLSHLRRQMLLVRIATDEGCSTYKVMKL